ncbi:DUF3332 domain-containing protein [Paucihalobacter sp.]|uniref:DUF3332 domain-containing protein n=1 Tax=Paucihalobacter sp. TaxID=2850405 RepID=UPI002FE05D2D
MKKLIMCVCLSGTIMFNSCLGSFSAFNNLRDWNDGLTDSKFLDNLVFWVFNIIPVYGLFFVGDVIIFNVIEFWSGSNPIAMQEGEMEKQILEKDGNIFEMIATKNRIQVTVIDGKDKGQKIDLIYKPHEKSWNAVKQNGEIIKLASMEDGLYVMHMPNGDQVKMDPYTTREQGLAILNSNVKTYQDCIVAIP